jgi:hypothetical protein
MPVQDLIRIVAGIRVFLASIQLEDVDGEDKRGHGRWRDESISSEHALTPELPSRIVEVIEPRNKNCNISIGMQNYLTFAAANSALDFQILQCKGMFTKRVPFKNASTIRLKSGCLK